jgi:hypothetical protein
MSDATARRNKRPYPADQVTTRTPVLIFDAQSRRAATTMNPDGSAIPDSS